MEIIITMILATVLLIFGLGFAYVLFGKDKDEESANNKPKISKEEAIKKIGSKMLEAKENLEKTGFKIDTELISPIEEIGNNIYIKLVHFDLDNKKMAVTSISQSAKRYVQNIFDLKHAIDCKLIINDKEGEMGSNEEFKCLKLEVQSMDTYNPKLVIGILPKVVTNPEKTFKAEYLDFGHEIYRIVKEIIKHN